MCMMCELSFFCVVEAFLLDVMCLSVIFLSLKELVRIIFRCTVILKA